MLYNTGSTYDPVTGVPDNADHTLPLTPQPSAPSGKFGELTINAGMTFCGLDSSTYSPGAIEVSGFDNMLFYQRRLSVSELQIVGHSSNGNLEGTLYGVHLAVCCFGNSVAVSLRRDAARPRDFASEEGLNVQKNLGERCGKRKSRSSVPRSGLSSAERAGYVTNHKRHSRNAFG